MEHLLNDIIELIGNNMPDIRTVDEDYGQLEMLDDSRDSYPLIFPAVLIDSPETSWENIGGLSQKGLCTVSVRLCIDCYDDTHYNSGTTGKILSREEKRRELHRLLQGHCIGCGSALIRTSSRFYTANHGIKVYESSYTLEVTESCLPETTKKDLKVKVSSLQGKE
jgi:hypothetical protein